MAHIEKYTRQQIGGLTRHFERYEKENGEYIQFCNQEIDTTKTHLNYNLAPEKNQLEFIKKRTSEVKCLKRDNVNVMCSWVVTLPEPLQNDDEKSKKFFKETYEFLENEHEEENVISAHVHLDETTPHLHFAFVPVVMDFDKKQGKEIKKVSAKKAITRDYLNQFHERFDKHMTERFGYEIGILNGATENGNKKITELKLETAQEELSKALNTLEKQQDNIYKPWQSVKKHYRENLRL